MPIQGIIRNRRLVNKDTNVSEENIILNNTIRRNSFINEKEKELLKLEYEYKLIELKKQMEEEFYNKSIEISNKIFQNLPKELTQQRLRVAGEAPNAVISAGVLPLEDPHILSAEIKSSEKTEIKIQKIKEQIKKNEDIKKPLGVFKNIKPEKVKPLRWR
jgi:hypothetical protein